MGERTAICGYSKQYEYSAAVLYKLMQNGSFEGLRLCEPAADVFDDLVVFSKGHVRAVQVKSERNATYVSLNTELNDDLISSMVQAWKDLKEEFQCNVCLTYIFGGLFSTKDTGLANKGATGARHSAEFARFLSRGDLTTEIVQSSIWSKAVQDLKGRSGLDDTTFFEFVAGLSLEDERALHVNSINSFQPNERDNVEAIRSLLPRLVANTEPGATWLEQDLVNELGWRSRLSQRNSHVFPVPDDYQENNVSRQLLEQISNLSNGYVALVGPPGTGKSTLLQRELYSSHEFCVARYLAFHPDKRHGLGRAEAVEFFNDVIADLNTLGIHGSRFRSDNLAGLRQEFTRQLSNAHSKYKESGRKTVIAIDGLDHVPREETPQVSFLNELPAASSIPDGVILVLGTQRVDLPGVHPTIVQQLNSENRTVTIEPLSRQAVADFADAAGIQAFVSRKKLYDSCDGHPLSARYYIEALKNASTKAESELIFAADGLGQSLEQIYQRVWNKVVHTKATKDALALLARAEADLSCEQLAAASDYETVESVLQNAGFLLKRSANNRLTIYHNSFRIYVSRETGKRFGQINMEVDATYQSQLALLAESASQDDPQFWMRLRYLFRANDHDGVLALGNPEYFRASLRALRTPEEVFSDLRIVYGSIREQGDRVALLRTLLAEKETTYRLEAVSEIDFVDLLLQAGDEEMATRHALATGDTGQGWLRLVDHYWDRGQKDRARQVFEANEPLDFLFGESTFEPNQTMVLAEGWIERAHRFRPTDKLLKLVEGLVARRSGVQNEDDDDSWTSGSLKYHLALGVIDDGFTDTFTKLQGQLGLGEEECAMLAVHAAELAFTNGATDQAGAYLSILKASQAIEQAHQFWRRSAAKIAFAQGELDYSRKLGRTLTVPRLDRMAMSQDMPYLFNAIVDIERLAVTLDLKIPEEAQKDRLEPSDLLANAQNKLRQLGRLRGLASHQDAGITSSELRTVVLFFASAKPDRGDFSLYKYLAALPIIANHVLKAAKEAGDHCFGDMVSLIDDIIVRNDNNFSGSDEFRLAFAIAVFRFDGDVQQAITRIGSVEGTKKAFNTPHEAAESFAAIASAYCSVGQLKLARDCLNKLHDETFGYWLRAKKEPQYEFWKWIFSCACSESPKKMEDGALSFAQFLLGMGETEGRGTADRVYQSLLEGLFISPSAVAGIAARMYDSNIGNWAGITETTLNAVVGGNSNLAPLAVIASADLVVPYSESSLERLLSNALPTMSRQERAHPIHVLVQSVERWCPPSKRKPILDTIIEYAPETQSELEPIRRAGAKMASELRLVMRGEPRERDDLHDSSIGIDINIEVESLAALVAYGEGKSPYSDRVDYYYARAAEGLIPTATESEIREFLLERPHIEASVACMVAISKRMMVLGIRSNAEEFLAKADASAKLGHWSKFLGGEKLAVQKLWAEIYPELSVDYGFDTLTSELAQGATDASSLFLNLDEVLEIVADPMPVAEFWSATQEHLEQYREFGLIEPVKPVASVETHLDLLAFVIVQGFSLDCREVKLKARHAAEVVARNTNDRRFVEKLFEFLHPLPDGRREAAALMNKLTDVLYLSTTLQAAARQELESTDIVTSTISEKVLKDLGESVPEISKTELPVFYRLQSPGGVHVSNFNPPLGLLSGGRSMWSDDPWTWTSMLEIPLSLVSEASGIPIEKLRRRCAIFMSEEGGRSVFGPEVEMELRTKLRRLTLAFPNCRPMALASLRAIGRLLKELFNADAIDPKVFPLLWEEIGGPSLTRTLPLESPKPEWLEWPELSVKQNGGIEADSWMSDSEQALRSTILPDGLVLAEFTHFSLHAWRETLTLNKLSLPVGANLSKGICGLPRVLLLDGLRPIYKESESKLVARIADNLFGDIEDQTLCICPYIAAQLGWVSTNRDPLVYCDSDGKVACKTVRWIQGTYSHQPSFDAEMFGKGQFLHLTHVGLSRFHAAGIDFSNGVRVFSEVKREAKEVAKRELVAPG